MTKKTSTLRRIRQLLRKYRPARADRQIEFAMGSMLLTVKTPKGLKTWVVA